MKIVAAQLNFKIGDFDGNARKMVEHIQKAKKGGADLIVFSELSVTGYYPFDLLARKEFIRMTENSVAKIAKSCIGIAAVVGAPRSVETKNGNELYNCAFFLAGGKIVSFQDKTVLSDHGAFDESRHFKSNQKFQVVEYRGERFGITIGDDFQEYGSDAGRLNKNSSYGKSPTREFIKLNPDFLINISAIPFAWNQEDERKDKLCATDRKIKIPVLQVNQVGANAELIFGGNSLFINQNGEIAHELNRFEEDFRMVDTKNSGVVQLQEKTETIEKIHDALVLGIRDFFQKSGLSKALIGLSGGIDSAVTLALAERALGAGNVWAVLLPSEISPEHSVADARELAENLKIRYDILPIQKMVDSFNEKLFPLFRDTQSGVAEENIQARVRGTLLMALSNKFGHILLNTSNKSESAVGYGTLYGDMTGSLAVLADVYKTDVYNLARFINRKGEIIPENTVLKPPSAELRPSQLDTDSLPDYAVLDKILFHYIEQNLSPCEIVSKGFAPELTKRVIRLVNSGEFKRFQAAPVLRVSSLAFGNGRRMPLVAKFPYDCHKS